MSLIQPHTIEPYQNQCLPCPGEIKFRKSLTPPLILSGGRYVWERIKGYTTYIPIFQQNYFLNDYGGLQHSQPLSRHPLFLFYGFSGEPVYFF